MIVKIKALLYHGSGADRGEKKNKEVVKNLKV